MKTRTLIGIMIIATATFLTSCRGYLWNCIDGNGYKSAEYRYLENFDEVTVTGDYDVYINQGNEYDILIQADENLLPYVVTDVSGDNLKIKNYENRCLNPTGSIDIYITMPEINKLKLTGSGLIVCDSLDADDLEVELIGSGDIELGYGSSYIYIRDEIKIENTGSGDIYIDLEADVVEVELIGSGDIVLEGSADESDLYIAGSGDIESEDLEVDECFAKIVGSGDIFVNVRRILDVKITGSGDLYYIGNPDRVYQDITGSGDLVNRDN
ncbi:head GIN domain-containing protein [Bacteroidota bacterium]